MKFETMATSSVNVVTNSLRLRKARVEPTWEQRPMQAEQVSSWKGKARIVTNGIIGWFQRLSGRRRAGQELKGSGRTAKDPVCGMEVDVEKAAGISVYSGQAYYFCAPGCKQAFDANPEKYLRAAAGMRGPAH